MLNLQLDLRAALQLFNRGQFFDAHEALEDLWRELSSSDPAKKHLQGLVQLAVAFHHESKGNLRGAKSVLDRALRNLAGADVSFANLDWEQLWRDMTRWQQYFAHKAGRPDPPRITWRENRPASPARIGKP